MDEFCRLAKMILRERYTARRCDQPDLNRLLVEHCTDEVAFEAVERAVLDHLSGRPATVLRINPDGRRVLTLSESDVTKLANATAAEVFNLMKKVAEEIAAAALRFEVVSRTLYVKGRAIKSWRDQNCGPQVALLTAFQHSRWDSPIPNPLKYLQDLGSAVKHLNKDVKDWIRFKPHGKHHVSWQWPSTTSVPHLPSASTPGSSTMPP